MRLVMRVGIGLAAIRRGCGGLGGGMVAGWAVVVGAKVFFAPERKFCLQFKNYEDISVLVPCVTGL